MKRSKPPTRLKRFMTDISVHTPFSEMLVLLIVLWLIFSGAVYFSELNSEGSSIRTYGDALYWCVAAFTTAGIADTPISSMAQFIGGLWIVIGSTLFFGAIVATVTTYFMRPMQRPHKRIIDTIEYNLEQLNDLTIDELDLLKETVDTLIIHVERIKQKQTRK
ncbi:ion channel [Photobacterium sp.]|uniref:ion channel n=1 Tax=Photobacterium sp. TaxID=660 RepID=UPI00299DC280|nr:ion channel [Photobacterium sp.]MDX1301281.1 ion channel [Photobacterium sp.]